MTSPPLASPISARRRSSGIAAPATRAATRSSGRTRAPKICATHWPSTGGQDRFAVHRRSSAGDVFFRAQTSLAPGKCAAISAAAPRTGDVLFGTIDSWLIWLLTGGPDGGVHVTDVTNASRTMLMDLKTLDWSGPMLETLKIPRRMLPRIVPSIDPAGWGTTRADGPFGAAIPVCGSLGDQQAALVGQTCFEPGESKNTYGTGCFMLLNTGEQPVVSPSGLLTTVAYQVANRPAVYALEGSIAVAGALVQWLRDNLGLIDTSADVELLAASVSGQRRRLFRAGVFRVFRAVLALRCPRGDRRADRLCQQGPSRPRGSGSNRLPDARRAGGHAARLGRGAREPACGWGHVGQRSAHAVSGRYAGCPGRAAARHRNHRGRRRLCRRPCLRVLEDFAHLRREWKQDKIWTPRMSTVESGELLKGWHKAVDRSMRWA